LFPFGIHKLKQYDSFQHRFIRQLVMSLAVAVYQYFLPNAPLAKALARGLLLRTPLRVAHL
jgi:hypothetical protein